MVAAEQASLLFTEQRIVGRGHIQHDLGRGSPVTGQKQFHQQVDSLRLGHDPFARGSGPAPPFECGQ